MSYSKYALLLLSLGAALILMISCADVENRSVGYPVKKGEACVCSSTAPSVSATSPKVDDSISKPQTEQTEAKPPSSTEEWRRVY